MGNAMMTKPAMHLGLGGKPAVQRGEQIFIERGLTLRKGKNA